MKTKKNLTKRKLEKLVLMTYDDKDVEWFYDKHLETDEEMEHYSIKKILNPFWTNCK